MRQLIAFLLYFCACETIRLHVMTLVAPLKKRTIRDTVTLATIPMTIGVLRNGGKEAVNCRNPHRNASSHFGIAREQVFGFAHSHVLAIN